MLKSRIPEIAAGLEAALARAKRTTAHRIESGAKDRVPVATGRLQHAIHVEEDDHGNVSVVAGDHVAWYGHIVEHGGRSHPPHPFLVPAAESERGFFEEEVRREVRGL